MLTLNSKKSFYIVTAILLLIIVFLLLPIKINYSLFVNGKILPAKEWIIYKGTDGRLTSLLTNYITGINESYDVTLFDRGDVMQFEFNSGLHSGSIIKKEDTVAVIYSNEIERQIENLKGQITISRAALALNMTGEKQPVIEQEKNNLNYAIKQAEEHEKIFERIYSLYQKGLVSQEEYEIAKGNHDLNQINISISKAKLSAVQTGAKQEQIEFIKSQINSLEKELNVLQKRFKGFTIKSPIYGKVNRKTNSDTLMIISDTSDYIIICPVNIKDLKYIEKNTKVAVSFNGSNNYADAKVYDIGNNVTLLNGTQVVIVSAKIFNGQENIMPSLITDCYINAGSLTPLEYVKRTWNRLVN